MSYGLIGAKLSHSYSKKIHDSFGKYPYDLIELDADAFTPFMENRGFKGLNVTIPYKKSVIPFCDSLTPIAMDIGSVNTLYFRDGKLVGDNTDYFGFNYMVTRANISFKDKKVLILGAGGSSLMASKAAQDLGALEVVLASRNGINATTTLSRLSEHFDAQIIINTTPVGMYPSNGDTLICLKDFSTCEGVIDLIYNPLLSKLLCDAKQLEIPYTNGLSMLVAQAIKAFALFTETDLNTAMIEATISQLENEILNIVLIGMPGCGKTTIGKLLADQLQRPFVDLDSLVEKETGMPIPLFFETFGEKEFRRLETLAAKNTGKNNGQIISTGGGVVLNPLNMEALYQNGVLFFLNRPLENLALEGRPLSKSLDSLKALAAERMSLYKDYGDYIIDIQDDPYENIDHILNLLGGK